MRAKRTMGDVRAGHVITYGSHRLTVTSVISLDEGRVSVSGNYARRGSVKRVGTTFGAGVLREVVIHNWQD